MNSTRINSEVLDRIVYGRVLPRIYAFRTGKIPGFLKVGDTTRPLGIRLDEWRVHFQDLTLVADASAMVGENLMFRDFAVHGFLERDRSRRRLERSELPEWTYYSNEFFKDATADDVSDAITDIREAAATNSSRYRFYSTDRLPAVVHYKRGESYIPRDNQAEVIANFRKAIANGRRNLLMFAVMRFGKSFTAMCCAKEMDAKSVLVLSAKADVRDEWKETVEHIGNFEGYEFATKSELAQSSRFLHDAKDAGRKIVLFLTLQDLQGSALKKVHREVFGIDWDLLLVDETHFGARGQSYGTVLREMRHAEDDETVATLEDLGKVTKELKVDVTIHLSGTPYRILMGDEFQKEDIIAFVQFSDIADAQKKWYSEHLDTAEYENPYFGFPQMVRFAFLPNVASLKKMEELRAAEATSSFSELFRPQALIVHSGNAHKKFVHPAVVLEWLMTIDGSRDDNNVLGFLDNERIKNGQLCRHIVMVLPYRASCDAMEYTLKNNRAIFRNLCDYEIVNISGLEAHAAYPDASSIKERIKRRDAQGKKTLTLTVNRMLTGSTVPQWDTMIFIKDTKSPQEYDQAIFRLQNPFIKELCAENSDTPVKYNLKPQIILVDFDPQRVFVFQELRSQIYNVNVDVNGNTKLRERIAKELEISPVITLDNNKLREVEAADVIDAVRNYSATRSAIEEAEALPLDFGLLNNDELKAVISQIDPIDSRKGLAINAIDEDDEEGDDIGPETADDNDEGLGKVDDLGNEKKNSEQPDRLLEKKFAAYMVRILLFAFLSDDNVTSLDDILAVTDNADNRRILKNVGLSKRCLTTIREHGHYALLQKLDYKIHNINSLSHDESRSVEERIDIALNKFSRLSGSEVVTPRHVVEEMLSILPTEALDGKILDIASKQGEFAAVLAAHLGEDAKDKLYSLCTSPLAYELTRKIYSILGLPVGNICEGFTTYDLISPDKKQNIIKKLKDMGFSTIIGNPPYQETDGGGTGDSAKPIYQHFVEAAIAVSSRCIVLITPSRWLKGGKGLTAFRNKMTEDRHLIELHDFADAKSFFPGMNIDGGVSYFLRDAATTAEDGKIKYVYTDRDGTVSTVNRSIKSSASKTILRDVRQLSIVVKANAANTGTFDTIVASRNPFALASDLFNRPEKYPKLGISEVKTDGYSTVYGVKGKKGGSRRTERYMPKSAVPKGKESVEKYKIFFSKAYMTTSTVPPARIMGAPGDVATETFLKIGDFDTATERDNCEKYICTKFFRALLFFNRSSLNISKSTFALIPLQDFTENSAINWNLAVENIDRQLYNLYGLTDEEIEFIENTVKPA